MLVEITEEVKTMGKKKRNAKKGQDDKALKAIVLATAILNLVKTLIDFIGDLVK